MIKTDIYEAINFYKDLTDKIKKENLNPFDIDIKKLKELTGDNLLTNAIIISILSKFLKLKAEYLHKQIIPEEEKENKIKSIFKHAIKEETGFEEDEIETLLMFESIREKLRKPKTLSPERISYKEFQEITKRQIKEVLHEDIDYNAMALEIAKQIEQGSFKIRSYKDFIGLMFAIYIYDLKIDDIKIFIDQKYCD